MQKQFSTNFTEGPIFRQLLSFSIPFMGANLLQALYNVVDMVIIGRFMGGVGLSAVSVAGQVTMLLTCLAMGFSTGAQVLIAQLTGRNVREDINRAIGTVFSTMLLLGALVTTVGLLGVNWFLSVLNTPQEAVTQARYYMLICNGGMIFTYGYNAVSAILRGMGDSKRPLMFITIASVLNLVLDLVFIAVFHMGAAGAALATIIGQAVSFLFSIYYLFRNQERFGFSFQRGSFRIDMSLFKIYGKLGLPMTLQMCAVTVSFMIINSYVNAYGVAASAISGVGSKLTSILSIVANSMQSACAGMVGQNISIGNTDRIKRIVSCSFGFCAVCAVVFCAVCLLFPRQVISLFSSDEEILALARPYLQASVAGYAGSFLMASTNGLILGVGAMTFNFIIAFLDSIAGRIGLSLLLGKVLGLGLSGFWWGCSLAGYITVFAGLIYYFSGVWKSRRILDAI